MVSTGGIMANTEGMAMESFEKRMEPAYRELISKQKASMEETIKGFDEATWNELLKGMRETPFKNRQMLKNDVKESLLKAVEPGDEDVMIKGFSLIFDNYPYILTSEEAEAFDREIKTLGAQLASGEKTIPKDPKVSLAESFSLSDNFHYCVQKVAIDFYNKNLFKEAKLIFSLLSQINPYVSDYHLSLGHTERALGNVENATYAYLNAGLTDIENPLPYLLASHINSEKEHVHAQNFLNVAKTIIQNSPDKTQYQEEVAALEQALSAPKEV
jgi:tetratricopeptide (TPR) repeat protein